MRNASFAIVLAACFLAVSARAEESDADLIAQGVQLRREQRDAEALERFRRAYELHPTPKTKVQIALAEQALGDWIAAERDLVEALSQDDPWIAARTEALNESRLEIQKHLASLLIETNVAGAELWQNGARVGAVSGKPIRITSGDLEIEIRAEGYRPARRSVNVPAESIVKLVVDLSPVADSAPPPPAPNVGAALPPASSSVQTTLAWVTLAAAGASLSTGIIGHVEHELNATGFNDANCWDGMHSGSLVCNGYERRANTAETVAIAGYVGAGMLGGASALLFAFAPRKGKTAASLDLTVLPSTVGVTWRGEF